MPAYYDRRSDIDYTLGRFTYGDAQQNWLFTQLAGYALRHPDTSPATSGSFDTFRDQHFTPAIEADLAGQAATHRHAVAIHARLEGARPRGPEDTNARAWVLDQFAQVSYSIANCVPDPARRAELARAVLDTVTDRGISPDRERALAVAVELAADTAGDCEPQEHLWIEAHLRAHPELLDLPLTQRGSSAGIGQLPSQEVIRIGKEATAARDWPTAFAALGELQIREPGNSRWPDLAARYRDRIDQARTMAAEMRTTLDIPRLEPMSTPTPQKVLAALREVIPDAAGELLRHLATTATTDNPITVAARDTDHADFIAARTPTILADLTGLAEASTTGLDAELSLLPPQQRHHLAHTCADVLHQVASWATAEERDWWAMRMVTLYPRYEQVLGDGIRYAATADGTNRREASDWMAFYRTGHPELETMRPLLPGDPQIGRMKRMLEAKHAPLENLPAIGRHAGAKHSPGYDPQVELVVLRRLAAEDPGEARWATMLAKREAAARNGANEPLETALTHPVALAAERRRTPRSERPAPEATPSASGDTLFDFKPTSANEGSHRR
ncbi:hypothetical protein AB0I28_33060 [Phytomonospora sp. NPDC050363]|uniref:hypothetical protein n=1 Tax=Phytomonospora sp. NPDC050363 TaxID=3155642 RepID=UPI0033C36C99